MMKILGIGFIALMCTLFFTAGLVEILITLWRMGYTPMSKELFIGVVSALFVWSYHWCWKKSL